jgi:hypothetical protein
MIGVTHARRIGISGVTTIVVAATSARSAGS